jgi:hypothetical protein
MPYFRWKRLAAAMALASSVGCSAALAQSTLYRGMGTPPKPEDIGNRAWSSGRSGKDLPPGKGTAKDGARIFLVKCAMCHGRDAEGVAWTPGSSSLLHGPRLGGGNSVPHFKPKPGQITTLAYEVPWATVIFNTIAIDMPLYNPATLRADEVYSLTAFVLFKNGIVKEDAVMDRETLPKVQMPNKHAYPASEDVFTDTKKQGCDESFGVCRDHN